MKANLHNRLSTALINDGKANTMIIEGKNVNKYPNK
jgi:hypothetical protein